MRFLADEGFDGPLTRLLQDLGHDIRRVSHNEADFDEEVARVAKAEDRILLTEDRDFGRIVFASDVETAGVIYFRFYVSERDQISEELVSLLGIFGETLKKCFVVMEPGRTRISRLPLA